MARPKLDGEGGEVVKKVRLTRAQAARLQSAAATLSMTESDVLRHGLGLVEREADRRRALQELMRLAEEDLRRRDGRTPKPMKLKLR